VEGGVGGLVVVLVVESTAMVPAADAATFTFDGCGVGGRGK